MAARPSPAAPRLVPPKRRDAAATVSAIEQAIDEVIATVGLESFTTRHVAERAGVGMGSLYRFFRTREAMIASWEMRRLEVETSELITLVQDSIAHQRPLAPTLRELVKRAARICMRRVRSGRDNMEFYASLAELQASAQPLVAVLESALAGADHRRRDLRIPIAVRVAISGVVFTSVVATRPAIEPDPEAWAEEIAEMITRYLVADEHLVPSAAPVA